MRLLPAAAEHLLCPACAWHVELQSARQPAECASLLNERRVTNLAKDVIHGPGRTAAQMRWTGPAATDHYDIVGAGLAGEVRAAVMIEPKTPVGSTLNMSFHFEQKQFVWDVLLFVLGWAFVAFVPTTVLYVAVTVATLFALTQLRRHFSTRVEASRLVELVRDATQSEITKAEGGIRIRLTRG